MAFIESVLEHSKKLGRISALVIILGVAGAISLIMVCKNAGKGDTILSNWIDLAKIAVVFYFAVAASKPSSL